MLTKRIIACLDVTNGRVVKGVQFLDLRDAGDPAELARRHAESGADEVVLLDITATHESRPILIDAVRRAARELFVPFTVGGGVRTLADASALFEAGADKITMNSAAVTHSRADHRSRRALRLAGRGGRHRCQARRRLRSSKPRSIVTGGRTPTGIKVLDWSREVERRGAGEILLTSMDRDGTQIGFDCPLTAAAARAVSIPVIASGGAGNGEHFVDVFKAGCADAALAASIFHFGTHDLRELKRLLQENGIPMRLPC